MRILHIITGLNTGGAERALYNLLYGGLANKFDNEVISLSEGGAFGARIIDLGVSVHCLGMRRGLPSPPSVAKLLRRVKDFQPDVIQGWMYHGNVAAWLAHFFSPEGPELAWNIRHSLYDLGQEKLLTRQVIRANCWLSKRPMAIVYNSRLSRRQHEAFGFSSLAGRVIPNGFDLECFSTAEDIRWRVRAELGIPQDAVVVGHVARFHPVKDHEGFLRAAVRVAGRLERVHFILGGCDVVLGNPSLSGLVPETMQARFHFLGERGDVPDLMRAMDVFCQSSWSEAFPNVLGEAMATSVPCVATGVGDSADIIGDTGVVVPPRDAEALAGGLERLLTTPLEERRALGAAARARVEAHYALGAVVEQYAELYSKIKN